jgi:IK cytokine
MNQNDFRKLLATPRPSSDAKAPPTTTQAKKTPSIDSSSSKTQFAKPTAVVKNKKKKEWKRPDETESNLPKVRDRAKERREGINIDYKDSEEIIQRLSEM